MKSSQWFVLASAVAGCAVALGLYLVRNDAVPATGLTDGPGPAKRPADRGSRDESRRLAGTDHRPGTDRARTSRPESADTGGTSAPLRVTGKPVPGVVASEAEWYARAAKVEQEANREVRRLQEVLDLNADQQARIFGLVARNSGSWLPGMQAGGTPYAGAADTGSEPGQSEADQVMAYLDADQQQTLIQEEMDRRAWWEEVLPQLLPPDLPAATVPATTVPADEVKPFDGAETLQE